MSSSVDRKYLKRNLNKKKKIDKNNFFYFFFNNLKFFKMMSFKYFENSYLNFTFIFQNKVEDLLYIDKIKLVAQLHFQF